MRICIVGGGKIGYYLAKTLLEHGHTPVIVEPDEATANKVANELDIPVIYGDGTSVEALESAGAENCQAFVAASGKDEVNLISAQLAKKIFNVKKTIARVNNPKNTAALKALGVDIVISATDNIAHLIEREVETKAVRQLMNLAHGNASLVEITIPDTFKYDAKTLTEIPVPIGCVVISITRADAFFIPNGASIIKVNDRLMVAATDEALRELIVKWRINDHKRH